AAIEEFAGGVHRLRDGWNIALREVTWISPFAVQGEAPTVHVALSVEEADAESDITEVAFKIFSASDGSHPGPSFAGKNDAANGMTLDCQGWAEVRQTSMRAHHLDLESLRKRCRPDGPSVQECYDAYHAMAIEYGPAHRSIEGLWLGSNSDGSKFVLSKL